MATISLVSRGPTPSNDLKPTLCPVSPACVAKIAAQHPGFHKIVVLAGAPDPSIHNPNVLLTHEFDRNDTLSNVTSVLRQYQRQSLLFSSDSTTADQSVTVERVSLKAWPAILCRLIHARNALPSDSHSQTPSLLVFNLCDGCDELDGYPGGSVPRDLEANGFAYTGSMSEFYRITTPKTLLKSYLQRHLVPTSDFVEIHPDTAENDVDTAIALLGFPLIVKPSISYASLGITSTSVTHTRASTLVQVASILTEFPLAGVFIERYLAGREFTAVVTGDAPGGRIRVYPAAERAFRQGLKASERFLAFDRYWAGWTIDGDRPPEDAPAYYTYRLAPDGWQAELMRIAREAYIACNGSGYGRVDIRTANMDDCEAYVLEVNANCGLTFDETSSLGEILRLSQVAPLTFLQEIIQGAVARWTSAANINKSGALTQTTSHSPIPDKVAKHLSNLDLNESPLQASAKRADSVLGSRPMVFGAADVVPKEEGNVAKSASIGELGQGSGV